MNLAQTNIEVIPATAEQAPILANLLELYCYDFSELIDLKIDALGRFGYAQLPLYWTEANRFPFLIQVDGHWAGFALVCKGSQLSGDKTIWDMAEFFILRGYRRSGIGRQAAHQVWEKCPGSWEVRVLTQNPSAKDFWHRAISEFIGQTIESRDFAKGEKRWQVFSFDSQDHACPIRKAQPFN